MRDLLVNLLASVVAGSAVWVTQRLLRYQKLARERAFFCPAAELCWAISPAEGRLAGEWTWQ